mgnify:CR=1 FL=1
MDALGERAVSFAKGLATRSGVTCSGNRLAGIREAVFFMRREATGQTDHSRAAVLATRPDASSGCVPIVFAENAQCTQLAVRSEVAIDGFSITP